MARNQSSLRIKKTVPSVAGPGITEQHYFSHIRSFTEFRFKIRPRYFETLTFSQFETVVEKELSENRSIICVFDMDETREKTPEKKKYELFIKKYSSNRQVIICESMPSIEYWFLIHYLNTSKHFKDSNASERELRKYIPHYRKNTHFLEKDGWVKELCKDNKLDTAIKRAKTFGTSNPSYSNVYKAFELF